MFSAISNDHREIRHTMAELRALLVEDGLPIGHWFASIRWSLTRQALRHFATVALSSPDGEASAFEQRYRRHLSDWTPARIDREWASYCRELHTILDELEADLAADECHMLDEPRRLAVSVGAGC